MMTLFSYPLPSNIQTEIIVEVWAYPLSANGDLTSNSIGSGKIYTIWELSNGLSGTSLFQLDLNISDNDMKLILCGTTTINTVNSSIQTNKWVFIQARISYSNAQSLVNNNINSSSSIISISSYMKNMPNTLSNVNLFLTKNHFGYIRNFRIWNDFLNYQTYFNNYRNTPNPIYIINNNVDYNKLIVYIPANHSGKNNIR